MQSYSNITQGIDEEIRKGLSVINPNNKIITIFGSTRIREESEVYKHAQTIGKYLAENGFAIMTGGGPGIMEAAAKGANLAGGVTYGINIQLPHEQEMNPYINRPFICNHLISRKHLLMNYSSGFIIFDGGFGTLDELFEVLTLMATEKMETSPVILFGSTFWLGLKNWMAEVMPKNGYIETFQLDILKILDNPKDIINIFK